MATSSITFGTDHGASGLSGLVASIARVLEVLRHAQAAASDFERLNALSDRGLARRGLTRRDISRVVMERHFS